MSNFNELFDLFVPFYSKKAYRHEPQHCWLLTLGAVSFVSEMQLRLRIAEWKAKHSYSDATCVLKWSRSPLVRKTSRFPAQTIGHNITSYKYRRTWISNFEMWNICTTYNGDVVSCRLMACWSTCTPSTFQLKLVTSSIHSFGNVTCGCLLFNWNRHPE